MLQHVSYTFELKLIAAAFMSEWVEFVKRARPQAFLIRLPLSDPRISSFRSHGANPTAVSGFKRAEEI
jgi:hypothetical protein